jgi:uncharacterized protein involved in exopolysaccharide biosynthesis
MSRIDEALKRLAGVTASENRAPSMLDRYVSEGVSGSVESAGVPRPDEGKKITSFITQARRVREDKPPSAKGAQETPHVRHAVEGSEERVDAAPLVDVAQLYDYVRFVGRSVRRHRILASVTMVLVLTTIVGFAEILPRRYHVQTKLLAQRNAVMTALSNPNRAVPWDADAPTRAAAETVLRRDNLLSLIKQTNLLTEWERTRPRALKFKDWLMARWRGHDPTADEKLQTMIDTLEARMTVVAGPVGDGTVTIDLDWPDAEMAYRLVKAAEQSFVDARLAAEAAAIGESITILERYSGSLHEDITRAFTEMHRAQAKPGAGARSVVPRPATSRAQLPADPPETLTAGSHLEQLESDPELSAMKNTLQRKRQELTRIEEERQRQLTDLQTRLAQLKTVYTSDHPSVINTQQSIAALAQDTPQALALAAQIEELQADYDRKMSAATDLQIKQPVTSDGLVSHSKPAAAPVVDAAPTTAEQPQSPSDEVARLQLRSQLNELESVLERTDGARIELEVSKAGSKFRYTVIRPAQIPREPVFPNMKLMFIAGLIASGVLALLVCIGRDLFSHRIFETWQIERQLGLRVFGTLG